MKKKVKWTFAIMVILIGMIFILPYVLYEKSKDFYGFPIPKNAEVEKEKNK